MSKLVIGFFLLAASIAYSSRTAQATPILNVSSGKLLGASNVMVMGNRYDVEFLDGSFNSLFGNNDLIFQSPEAASAASAELIASVFTFLPIYSYQYPSSINGLQDTVPTVDGMYSGSIYTPYSAYNDVTQVAYAIQRAYLNSTLDPEMQPLVQDNSPVGLLFTSNLVDTTLDDSVVYAVWTPAPVPEPSTLLLLGSGLAGLAWYGAET